MKEYLLLVLDGSYLKLVTQFIDEVYKRGNTLGAMGTDTPEEFRLTMFTLLKQYWQFRRTKLPDGFEDILPPVIRSPLCSIVKKKARQEFTIAAAEKPIPMFNYAGKLMDAGRIPNILAIFGTETAIECSTEQIDNAIKEQVTDKADESKADEAIKNLFEGLKGFENN